MKRLLTILALVLIALSVLVWRMPASVLRLFMPPDAARVVQLHRIGRHGVAGSALLSLTGCHPRCPLPGPVGRSGGRSASGVSLGDAVAGSVVLNAVTSRWWPND